MENTNAAEQSVEKAPEIITGNMPPKGAEAVKPVVSQGEETVTLTKAEADNLIKAAEEATALAQKKTDEYSNLQKWNIKLKDKLKENGLDEEEEEKTGISEERIGQIFEEKLKAFMPIVEKKDEVVENATKVISELKTALANRSQITSTGAGSNFDKPETANTHAYWSPAQIEELKKRNLDPDEVLKNMPKSGLPGSPNA